MAVSNQPFRVWVRLAGFIGLFGHVRTGTLWMKCVSTDTHRWKCGAWRFVWIYCLMLLAVSVADPLSFTFWKFILKKKIIFITEFTTLLFCNCYWKNVTPLLYSGTVSSWIDVNLRAKYLKQIFKFSKLTVNHEMSCAVYTRYDWWRRWWLSWRINSLNISITKWNFSQHLDGN